MMKRLRRDYRRSVLVVILLLLTAALIISVTALVKSYFNLAADAAASMTISAIESIGLIVSLIIAISQLKDSKEIALATFITDLNKSFVENDSYLEIYNKLQDCLDNSCECESPCGNRADIGIPCELDVLKGQISNYLTFFETIYLLKKNKVLSFEVLDELFAYRFFLAVHSKIVQQKKIKPQPLNFKNIFCLEYEWLRWRKDHGKDGDPYANTVYTKFMLKDLVDENVYWQITKDCDN